MRYTKEGLGVPGVLPSVVIHELLRVVTPKWCLGEYEFSQANKMGEGSSMEKKENIKRHQKGIGKWYNQRRASSVLQLHKRGDMEQGQEIKLE